MRLIQKLKKKLNISETNKLYTTETVHKPKKGGWTRTDERPYPYFKFIFSIPFS